MWLNVLSLGLIFIQIGLLYNNPCGAIETGVRISAQKCTEYQKNCAGKTVSFSEVSGDADAKEFPFVALLGYVLPEGIENIKWQCSGSIISDKFVLTGSTCITQSISRRLKYVRVGDLDYNSDKDNDAARQFTVLETFAHPFYKSTSQFQDVGLIKIDGTFEFNEFIQPICLGNAATQITTRLIAAGYGKTSQSEQLKSHVQRVQLTFTPHAECKSVYQPYARDIIDEIQICGLAPLGGPDSCSGFSGSAILSTEQKSLCLYEAVGITAFGGGCGNGIPGVYTRISAYLDWIEDIAFRGGNGSTVAVEIA